MPTDDERMALKAVVNLIRLSEPLIFDLWRSHELTIAQVQCLRILSHQPEQAGELAKKLSMSSTSLTRILERLESRGLVERTVDVHDRRRIWVRLTETGQTRVSSMTSWYNTPLFAAIRRMSLEERNRFVEVIEHYTAAVREAECSSANKSTTVSSVKD